MFSSFSIENFSAWLGDHPASKTALACYAAGAAGCILIYGVRKGVRGLRQYHIDQEEKKGRVGALKVDAETALDIVLFESLKGCAQGIIPSVVWPAHLGAYAIVKWKEDDIVKEVKAEIQASKKAF